jgi:hypothetical protein
MKKKIPKFKSEEKEQEFWSTADSTEFIDWKKARRLAPQNLPSSNYWHINVMSRISHC